MATRTVTGLIRTPTGAPWSGFPIDFTLTPSTYVVGASLPEQTVRATTAGDGTFSVVLTTGVAYTVAYPDVYKLAPGMRALPKGSTFTVVVPDGVGSVALDTLQAAANVPVAAPSVLTLLDQKADAAATTAALATKAAATDVAAITANGWVTRPRLGGDVIASQRARVGRTAVALGNSHVAANGSATIYPGQGWWGLLPILSQGRIRPVGWASTGGQTSAQLLARFDADVAPNAPDFVFIQEVTNDVGQVTFATTKANFTAIWDKCLAIGAMPITIAGPPFPTIAADTPTNAKAQEVIRRNLWLAEESARRGLIYVDIHSKLVDPATGALAAAYYQGGENVHPNAAGHTLMAQTIWDAIGSLFPATGKAPLSVGKGEPTNLIPNGVCVGDANADGVADNWLKSGANATGTLEAGTGDVLGNWQVLTINTAGAAWIGTDQILPGPTTYQDGDTLMLSGRVRTTAGTTHWTPKVDRNATGSMVRGIYQANTDLDGTFSFSFVVPAATVYLRPAILSGPTGTGVAKVAQWMLRNLSAEARG